MDSQRDLWISAILFVCLVFLIFISWFPEENPLRHYDRSFPHELFILFPLIFLTGPRPWPIKIGTVTLGIILILPLLLGAPHPYPGILTIGGFSYMYIYRLVWFQDPPIPKVEVYTISTLFILTTAGIILGLWWF